MASMGMGVHIVFHLYAESKIVKLTEAESRMMVARGLGGGGGNRELGCSSGSMNFQVSKTNEL